MLKVIETPHRGAVRTWFADDMNDFAVKVLASNPRADINPDASNEELAEWLRSDLQSLDIESL